ncbi:hypothetical protein Q75_02950 [Bacillus coahuilensis p1.1.43]|uniref:Uncharacterized protein n=1 Tax=Bacillus coahuilensis p1.1.43 TaxID=1150625 RepID=A0A147KBA3_9BACI|nr:hypothetical protein Q75_02950 [Bacillus coahuilensis p1.1.43]
MDKYIDGSGLCPLGIFNISLTTFGSKGTYFFINPVRTLVPILLVKIAVVPKAAASPSPKE